MASSGFYALFSCFLFIFCATCFAESDDCSYRLAESIPYGLNDTLYTSYYTSDALFDLVSQATSTLDLACFYLTLNATDDLGMAIPPGYGHDVGVALYQEIVAAQKRGVKIRIAMSAPTDGMASTDAFRLQDLGVELRLVNMSELIGGGVLHSKFLIADSSKFYVGSANMDWRSLTQVKELGIKVDCEPLAKDLLSVFEVYWKLGKVTKLPSSWSSYYDALANLTNPAMIEMNGSEGSVFLSSAPEAIDARYRTYDLDALISVINNATESISIEVMDYFPTTLYYSKDTPNRIYWPDIDDALRAAAFNRQVHVRLLISQWNYTIPDMFSHLQSIQTLPTVEVKLFKVPVYETYIPYTRVNHAKFMVTDKNAFITTSNWSGDYFLNTCGVSFVTNQTDIINDLASRFERDWTSGYAVDLPPCPSYPE